MKWVRVRRGSEDEVIREAVAVLKDGGLVIYPTDTVYGLGADAENSRAVERVYEVKRRNRNKPLTIAVSGIEMVRRYAVLDPVSEELLRRFLPGKVTFILPKTERVPDAVNPSAIGIRIPNVPLILRLIDELGRAITSTSANRSGNPPRLDPREAASEVEADLVIDAGVLPPSQPSTVVDLTRGEPRLVREGDIPFSLIVREFERLRGRLRSG